MLTYLYLFFLLNVLIFVWTFIIFVLEKRVSKWTVILNYNALFFILLSNTLVFSFINLYFTGPISYLFIFIGVIVAALVSCLLAKKNRTIIFFKNLNIIYIATTCGLSLAFITSNNIMNRQNFIDSIIFALILLLVVSYVTITYKNKIKYLKRG